MDTAVRYSVTTVRERRSSYSKIVKGVLGQEENLFSQYCDGSMIGGIQKKFSVRLHRSLRMFWSHCEKWLRVFLEKSSGILRCDWFEF